MTGSLIRGPLLFLWHRILNDYIPCLLTNVNERAKNLILFLIDRIIFAPPFVLLTLYITQMLERGGKVDGNTKRLYAFALLANQKIWILGKIILCQLPSEAKAIFYHIISIVWHLYLSSL
jgi:hypothetical protein